MGRVTERKNSKGKTVYYAEIRRRGSPTAYNSFERLTDARNWIHDTESNMRSGRYLPQTEAQKHIVSDAIERYLAEELPKKPKSIEDVTRQLKWFAEQIGFKFLAEATPALINETKGKFLRGTNSHGQPRKPQSWNRYLSAISCVFQMCVNEWLWLEYNPARRVKREREAPGRVRFLADEERMKLLAVCKTSESPNLYPLVVLTLSTGMRRGEVRGLKWEQVELQKGVIILDTTKNGERRRVAVRGVALDLLREHARVRRIDTNFVFPGAKSAKTGQPFDVEHFWQLAVAEAGLKDFRFHDLRHSTASYLAMSGASLLEIAEVLGHKTLQMVKRYSHLAESHTAGVVERMNQKIFG